MSRLAKSLQKFCQTVKATSAIDKNPECERVVSTSVPFTMDFTDSFNALQAGAR